VLLDSNIIIYSAQLEYSHLRELIAEKSPVVSALSYLEVLGYHQLTDEQRQYFDDFFKLLKSYLSPEMY
jgi:toxin FitB